MVPVWLSETLSLCGFCGGCMFVAAKCLSDGVKYLWQSVWLTNLVCQAHYRAELCVCRELYIATAIQEGGLPCMPVTIFEQCVC